MTFVVDTNVAIAANGRGTHVDEQCQLACVQKLRSLVAQETVAIDDRWLVLDEYKKHLNFSGMPGVGDVFFKHVVNNQSQGKYAFALRDDAGTFAAFAQVAEYAKHRDIPVVPVLFRGRFRSVAEINAFMNQAHDAPSVLGGEREGVVMRLARGFPAAEFQDSVCKSVRVGHVQTDEHWTRKWRPCRIARQAESFRPVTTGRGAPAAGAALRRVGVALEQ